MKRHFHSTLWSLLFNYLLWRTNFSKLRLVKNLRLLLEVIEGETDKLNIWKDFKDLFRLNRTLEDLREFCCDFIRFDDAMNIRETLQIAYWRSMEVGGTIFSSPSSSLIPIYVCTHSYIILKILRWKSQLFL